MNNFKFLFFLIFLAFWACTNENGVENPDLSSSGEDDDGSSSSIDIPDPESSSGGNSSSLRSSSSVVITPNSSSSSLVISSSSSILSSSSSLTPSSSSINILACAIPKPTLVNDGMVRIQVDITEITGFSASDAQIINEHICNLHVMAVNEDIYEIVTDNPINLFNNKPDNYWNNLVFGKMTNSGKLEYSFCYYEGLRKEICEINTLYYVGSQKMYKNSATEMNPDLYWALAVCKIDNNGFNYDCDYSD